jgi:hypothetical protein
MQKQTDKAACHLSFQTGNMDPNAPMLYKECGTDQRAQAMADASCKAGGNGPASALWGLCPADVAGTRCAALGPDDQFVFQCGSSANKPTTAEAFCASAKTRESCDDLKWHNDPMVCTWKHKKCGVWDPAPPGYGDFTDY